MVSSRSREAAGIVTVAAAAAPPANVPMKRRRVGWVLRLMVNPP
jgi:hypothetical protein